jgi:hypothetical protein
MVIEICEHQWIREEIFMPGDKALYRCHKCSTRIDINELATLENIGHQSQTLDHIKGFQSWTTIISLIISSIAIIISIIALLK